MAEASTSPEPRRAAPAPRQSPAAPAQGCTNLKVRQLARLVTRDYDARVSGSGMKTTQYSLLSNVVRLGPVRPSDLAAQMRLDASTLTRNLHSLVAQGWVELAAGSDGRSRLVVATEAGRDKRAQTQRAWKLAQLELNQRLGVERVARLHTLIDECLELLEADRGDAGAEC